MKKHRCAQWVPDRGRSVAFHQCVRWGSCYDKNEKKWYCKQHAPAEIAKRKANQITCAYRDGCDVLVQKEKTLCSFHSNLWRVVRGSLRAHQMEAAVRRLIKTIEAGNSASTESDLRCAKRALSNPPSPFRKSRQLR